MMHKFRARPIVGNLTAVLGLGLVVSLALGGIEACGTNPETPLGPPHPLDSMHAEALPRALSAAELIWRLSQLQNDGIELSRLALHRACHAAVLERQQSMLAQHQRLLKELNQVARRTRMRVATTMDAFGESLWTALFHKSDDRFERHLQVAQGDLHAYALRLFEVARDNLEGRELRNYVLHAQTAWKKLH